MSKTDTLINIYVHGEGVGQEAEKDRCAYAKRQTRQIDQSNSPYTQRGRWTETQTNRYVYMQRNRQTHTHTEAPAYSYTEIERDMDRETHIGLGDV